MTCCDYCLYMLRLRLCRMWRWVRRRVTSLGSTLRQRYNLVQCPRSSSFTPLCRLARDDEGNIVYTDANVMLY